MSFSAIYYNGQSIGLPTWTRPSDWLAMPTMTGTGGYFVGLLAIYSGSGNFVALNAQSNYTVDWGDGVTTGNYISNTQANYNYNYNNISSSSYSSGTNGQQGYRQVLVKVTPSGNNSLTTLNLQAKNTQLGLPSNPSVGWLDITISGSNINSLSIGGSTVYLYNLQRANIINISTGLTNFTSMFQNCSFLQSVPLFNTQNGTNFLAMFNNCSSLQSVPLFNTQNGANFSYMFQYCYSLQSVPLFNTQNGANFTSMFNNCYSLQSVPLFNTQNVTNFTSMFQNCYSLQSVPLFNTQSGTNFSNMFNGCYSLQSVPLFNTQSGTDFTSMFNSCFSLQSVPLFNVTGVIGTNFSNMFYSCANLKVGALSGTKANISYANETLDYGNLLNIFNNLGIVSGGQTIQISSNFGTSSLTASDSGITTGKGWTIIN